MKTSRGPLRFLDSTSAALLIAIFLIGSVVGAYQWERNRKVPFDSARWIERPDKRYQMLDDLKSKLEAMKNDPAAWNYCVQSLGTTPSEQNGNPSFGGANIRQNIDPLTGSNPLATDRYIIIKFDGEGRYTSLYVSVN